MPIKSFGVASQVDKWMNLLTVGMGIQEEKANFLWRGNRTMQCRPNVWEECGIAVWM